MRLAGYSVEDVDGHGVEGVLPLPGLTVLIGRNGSGKTRLLETLAAHLDRSSQWTGRRSRITPDDAYAFGFLYLHGDWRGDDWSWVKQVIAQQDEESDEMAGPDWPLWSRPVSTLQHVVTIAAEHFSAGSPEHQQDFVDILGALFEDMLISYQGHELATIDAVVDARRVSPDLSARLLALISALPDAPRREPLFQIAVGVPRYVHLFHLGTLHSGILSLRLASPPIINVDARVPNGEGAIVAAITLAVNNAAPHPWLEAEGDRHIVDHRVEFYATLISARMREMAPAFLLELGTPAVVIPRPELWSVQGQVLLGLRGNIMNNFMDGNELSAGTRRWLNVLAMLTVNDVLPGMANIRPPVVVEWESGLPVRAVADRQLEGTLVLIDEPELHLHPLAQREVTDWLENLAARNHIIVATTHAPTMLGVGAGRSAIINTRRDRDQTIVTEMSGSVLHTLDEEAGTLGLERSDWLTAAGALLLVEGSHDVDVISHFFGAELQRAKVRLLPVRGHRNLTDGTVIVEFVAGLGLPVRVMLDDVRSSAILSGDAESVPTSEEKVVNQLIRHRIRFPNLEVIPYSEPDIICSLPMTSVQAAFPTAKPVDWETIIASWRSTANHPGFKNYAIKQLGISTTPDELVAKTLRAANFDAIPSDALLAAVHEFLASLD